MFSILLAHEELESRPLIAIHVHTTWTTFSTYLCNKEWTELAGWYMYLYMYLALHVHEDSLLVDMQEKG